MAGSQCALAVHCRQPDRLRRWGCPGVCRLAAKRAGLQLDGRHRGPGCLLVVLHARSGGMGLPGRACRPDRAALRRGTGRPPARPHRGCSRHRRRGRGRAGPAAAVYRTPARPAGRRRGLRGLGRAARALQRRGHTSVDARGGDHWRHRRLRPLASARRWRPAAAGRLGRARGWRWGEFPPRRDARHCRVAGRPGREAQARQARARACQRPGR